MNVTISFSCNIMGPTTMSTILSPLSPFLHDKRWVRTKGEEFILQFSYNNVPPDLATEMSRKVERNNGIIKTIK